MKHVMVTRDMCATRRDVEILLVNTELTNTIKKYLSKLQNNLSSLGNAFYLLSMRKTCLKKEYVNLLKSSVIPVSLLLLVDFSCN